METRQYPTQEAYLAEYAERTEASIGRMIDHHVNGDCPSSTVFDIDEMFVDTVERHVRALRLLARLKGVELDHIPGYDQVVKAGGSFIYGDTFGYSPDEWETVMERLRSLRGINVHAPLNHPEIVNILAAAESKTDMLGYVTAKPYGIARPTGQFYDTQGYTEYDLYERIGLPREPVVLRPANVHLRESAQWKSGILKRIHAARPGKPVILLDDSVSTAKELAAMNEARLSEGLMPIFQIVMADGSLTRPKIESGAFQRAHDLGIYMASWDQVPTAIDEIHSTWIHQQ